MGRGNGVYLAGGLLYQQAPIRDNGRRPLDAGMTLETAMGCIPEPALRQAEAENWRYLQFSSSHTRVDEVKYNYEHQDKLFWCIPHNLPHNLLRYFRGWHPAIRDRVRKCSVHIALVCLRNPASSSRIIFLSVSLFGRPRPMLTLLLVTPGEGVQQRSRRIVASYCAMQPFTSFVVHVCQLIRTPKKIQKTNCKSGQ